MPEEIKEDKKPVTALTDDKGQKSAMRIMCAWSLGIAGLLAFLDVGLAYVKCVGPDCTGSGVDNGIIYAFLTGAFGGKTGQKVAEKWR